ncbi:MAG: hypothetical protein AAF492_24590, partial [Verrucomicrobiota bacterium]
MNVSRAYLPCLVVLFGLSVAPAWSARKSPSIPPLPELIEHLEKQHDALKETERMSSAMSHIYPVCENLMLLLARCHEDKLDPKQVFEKTGPWEYFTAIWMPLEYLFLSGVERVRPTLDTLGISPEARNTSYEADLFSYFYLLHLLMIDEEGKLKLSTSPGRDYTQVLYDYRDVLRGMGIEPAKLEQLFDRRRKVRQWIYQVTEFTTIRRLATELTQPRKSGYFVIPNEDFRELDSTEKLGRAFRRVVMAGPEDYEHKWRCHAWMLERMTQLAKMEPRVRARVGLDIYVPLYKLLCHGGVPITVFKPYAEPTSTEQGKVYHFSQPYEGDRPAKNR